MISGGLNFYFGSGGYETVYDLKCNNVFVWCILFVPFYILTEFAPAISFALVMQKYNEAVQGPAGANQGADLEADRHDNPNH